MECNNEGIKVTAVIHQEDSTTSSDQYPDKECKPAPNLDKLQLVFISILNQAPLISYYPLKSHLIYFQLQHFPNLAPSKLQRKMSLLAHTRRKEIHYERVRWLQKIVSPIKPIF
jgi:hypothetical protein